MLCITSKKFLDLLTGHVTPSTHRWNRPVLEPAQRIPSRNSAQ
ncbi:hypothetical protein ACFFX0_10645 [Citricoccus parietis]|uniref:Uncharacterized protein n=1 Tax=Citricoccus parietis TaxID=592307 RepID=A0ABV5FYA5_9MICC